MEQVVKRNYFARFGSRMKALPSLHFTVIQPLYGFAVNHHELRISSDLTIKLQVSALVLQHSAFL
jgi:hypothetical protein